MTRLIGFLSVCEKIISSNFLASGSHSSGILLMLPQRSLVIGRFQKRSIALPQKFILYADMYKVLFATLRSQLLERKEYSSLSSNLIVTV